MAQKVSAMKEYEALQREMGVLGVMIKGLPTLAESGMSEGDALSVRTQFYRTEERLAEFKAKIPIYQGEFDEQ